jgi:hypothetical protein
MACERHREALADVAAGGPALAFVGAHLASCEGCRAELATLRQALSVADAEMAGLVAAVPSAGLAARIRQAVAEAEPSPARRFGWLWPAAAAAATLLVALAVWVGRAPLPETHVVVKAPGPSPVTPRDIRPLGPERSAIPAGESSSVPGVAPARGDEPRARAHAHGRQATPQEPEVLVPPGEGEALLRFAAHLQGRTVAPDSLLVADLSAPLPEAKAIEIRSLEIIPLDPAETPGTD